MKYKLSIIITGRNDNYDGNFDERLILSMSRNIQSLPDAEFIFVEWNPYLDRELTSTKLKKVLGDRVRCIVVHPEFHEEYSTVDSFLEYPPKNVGVRRALGEYIACMNSDVIFAPDLVRALKGPLKKRTVYRSYRIDIRSDYLKVSFPLHPKYVHEVNNGYMNAAGDFILFDRDTWFESTGYMESHIDQRLHKDAEIVWRLSDVRSLPYEFLGHMTHWRHQSSWSNGFKRDKVGDVKWDFKKCGFVDNGLDWGLRQAVEIEENGIVWLRKKEKLEQELSPIILNTKDSDEFGYKETLFDKEVNKKLSIILSSKRNCDMKTALVLGGHGFIGHHLARQLKQEGFWVRTVDIKNFWYGDLRSDVDDYVIGDLRDYYFCKDVFKSPWGNGGFDEVYQLAAWMGGAGVIFTGENDARIVHDSLLININAVEMAHQTGVKKIFFSSSACVYNQLNQEDPDNPTTAEDSAYPAYPDSDYGFEKLMSERLYQAYFRNTKLDIRIARFHNIYGIESAWGNGREKSPAAICRKIALSPDNGVIEIWGDGKQTRSYLYIDECLKGIRLFMDSNFHGPVNIGSDEMVSINTLVDYVKEIANKPNIGKNHIPGPLGVRGRNSDNKLIKEKLGWAPNYSLKKGLEPTYLWIKKQIEENKKDCPWAS